MLALGKSLSAKPSVRAPGVAPPWPVVRLQRTSFRVKGGDPDECLVGEIPAEWFGGWRNALHVHCFTRASRGGSGRMTVNLRSGGS